MTFKDFYESQQILGTVEEVEIDGIGKLLARVDTGNTGYNVLHAVNIQPVDSDKVRFATIDNKTLVLKKAGNLKVLVGKDTDHRYVVNLNIKIGSHFFPNTPFSLCDRSENQEKVLIGEPFLKQINALVDTTKDQVV